MDPRARVAMGGCFFAIAGHARAGRPPRVHVVAGGGCLLRKSSGEAADFLPILRPSAPAAHAAAASPTGCLRPGAGRRLGAAQGQGAGAHRSSSRQACQQARLFACFFFCGPDMIDPVDVLLFFWRMVPAAAEEPGSTAPRPRTALEPAFSRSTGPSGVSWLTAWRARAGSLGEGFPRSARTYGSVKVSARCDTKELAELLHTYYFSPLCDPDR